VKDFHAAKLKEIIHYIYTLIHIVRCRLVCAGLNLNKHNTNSSITLLFATIYESAWHALRTVICACLFHGFIWQLACPCKETNLHNNTSICNQTRSAPMLLSCLLAVNVALTSTQRYVCLMSTLRLPNVNVALAYCLLNDSQVVLFAECKKCICHASHLFSAHVTLT
jgi:hypothetical protein